MEPFKSSLLWRNCCPLIRHLQRWMKRRFFPEWYKLLIVSSISNYWIIRFNRWNLKMITIISWSRSFVISLISELIRLGPMIDVTACVTVDDALQLQSTASINWIKAINWKQLRLKTINLIIDHRLFAQVSIGSSSRANSVQISHAELVTPINPSVDSWLQWILMENGCVDWDMLSIIEVNSKLVILVFLEQRKRVELQQL